MATEFTKFPDLPLELRRKIWGFCATQGRVMELDCPNRRILDMQCVMGWSSHANALQPAFSLACREAREAALWEGGYLSNLYKLWEAKGFEQEPTWDDPFVLENPWFCPKEDTVHLNWDEDHADFCQITDCDNPIPILIAYAKVARGGSFMAGLVQPFEKEYTYFGGHPWSKNLGKNLSLIENLNDFKVCLSVITIHATAKQAVKARLFGSLATPVQLVETSDRETIRRMYELWFTTFFHDVKLKDSEPEELFEEMILTPDDFEARICRWQEEVERLWLWHKWIAKYKEGTLDEIDSPRSVWTGPDFDCLGRLVTGLHPENIWLPKHDFNKSHPWVQAIVDGMPRFHPVIMFRFCEAKCHTQGVLPLDYPEADKDHDFNYYAGRDVTYLDPYKDVFIRCPAYHMNAQHY